VTLRPGVANPPASRHSVPTTSQELFVPYIERNYRKDYDQAIDDINRVFKDHGLVPGHMVYVMFRFVKFWWHCHPRFDTINAIRGALSSTLTEFDRVVAGPYEDKAIIRNGDIG
jgi:hypothetical protein